MKPLLYLALLVAAFALGRATAPDRQPEKVTETIVRVDTIRITQPEIVVIRPKPTLVETLPKADCSGDSATVEVSYEQKIYSSPCYKAYVSGHNPRLDSIEVFQPVKLLKVQPQRRVSIGVQAGYGITPGGFQPYIGVGVSVRLY